MGKQNCKFIDLLILYSTAFTVRAHDDTRVNINCEVLHHQDRISKKEKTNKRHGESVPYIFSLEMITYFYIREKVRHTAVNNLPKNVM